MAPSTLVTPPSSAVNEQATMRTEDRASVETLGDFRLLHLIGKGSQGEVWLATDLLGRRVAVKRLTISSGSVTPHREEEALRHYQGLSNERHLVRVFHVGKTEGGLFYSMELADVVDADNDDCPVPVSLAYLLRTVGAMSTNEAKGIISEVLDGVAALHARGLLHRDIKPSNILRVDGTWKLADIGLITEDRTEVTALGTVEFIPPNGRIDKTADLYACGRVLYCLLTGLPARSFPTLPKSVIAEWSPQTRALNSAVSPWSQRSSAGGPAEGSINEGSQDAPLSAAS